MGNPSWVEEGEEGGTELDPVFSRAIRIWLGSASTGEGQTQLVSAKR